MFSRLVTSNTQPVSKGSPTSGPTQEQPTGKAYHSPKLYEIGTLRDVQSGHGRYYDGFGYTPRR
jgi:hypothetical protein